MSNDNDDNNDNNDNDADDDNNDNNDDRVSFWQSDILSIDYIIHGFQSFWFASNDMIWYDVGYEMRRDEMNRWDQWDGMIWLIVCIV